MPAGARAATALAAAAATLVLGGCQSPTGLGHLDILAEEPAEPVPEYVNSLGILEPGSARFLAEVDGIEYYVAVSGYKRGRACLVTIDTAHAEPEWQGASCGPVTDDVIATTDSDPAGALLSDTADEAALEKLAEDGWTEVSQNLWIR